MRKAKRILALALCTVMVLGMAVLSTPVSAVEKPTEISLVRAEQKSENSLDLYFSSNVHFLTEKTSGSVYAAVRIVDGEDTQNLIYHTEDTTRKPLQWGGSLSYFKADGSQTQLPAEVDFPAEAAHLRFTFYSSSKVTVGGEEIGSLSGIRSLVAEGGAYEGKKVMFCLEELNVSDVTTSGNGTLDTVVLSADDTDVKLRATKPAKTNTLDGAYCEISQPLQLTGVDCYGGAAFVFSFNEPVSFLKSGLSAFVTIIDAQQNFLKNEAGQIYQWQISGLSAYGSDGKAICGKLNPNSQIDANVKTIDAITALAEGIEGAQVVVRLEEVNGFSGTADELNVSNLKKSGRVDSVFASDPACVSVLWDGSSATLTPNRRLMATSDVSSDRCFAEIRVHEGAVTVEYAKVVGRNQVEFKFSEPVNLNAAGVSAGYYIRLVNSANEAGSNAAGKPYSWAGTVSATGEDTVYLFTLTDFNLGARSIADIFALLRTDESAAGLTPKLALSQSLPGGTGELKGLVDNISSLDGTRFLLSNRPSFDGCFTEITGTSSDELTVAEISMVNDDSLRIEFSEPVVMAAVEPFMALRLVNDNQELVWDGSTPLQFTGSYEWESDEHKALIWTLDRTQNNCTKYSVWSITDILRRAGGLSAFEGSARFGIEEKTDAALGFTVSTTNGAIDNITTADFRPLSASYAPSDKWAALYLAVALPEPALTLEKVELLNEKELLLTFSAPIAMQGTPFAGVRLVNDALKLQRDEDGKYLQWSGTLAPVDGNPSQLKWTLTGNLYGVKGLSEILRFSAGNLSSFSDSLIRFCLEETPAKEGAEPYHFLAGNKKVSNITYTDSPLCLDATLRSSKDSYDGVYQEILLPTRTVVLPQGEGFTASFVEGNGTVPFAQSVSFRVDLAAGYNPATLVVKANGQPLTGENGVYTLEAVTEDTTVTVEGPALYQYTVSLPQGEGYEAFFEEGSSATVAHGGSASFRVVLKEGYHPENLTVSANGEPLLPADGIYTIENITGNVIVTVEGVRINEYTVSLPQGEGFEAAFEEGFSASVSHGGSTSFRLSIGEKYDDANLIVKANGQPLTGENGVYTVENVTENVIVTVEGLAIRQVAPEKKEGTEQKLGELSDLSLTYAGSAEKFESLLLDGKLLTRDTDFTVVPEGNRMKIVLKASALEGLTAGEHQLSLSFAFGESEVSFSLAPATPPTGDAVFAALIVLALAGMGLSALFVLRRKEQ